MKTNVIQFPTGRVRRDPSEAIIARAFGREALIVILPIVRIERPQPPAKKPGKRKAK